MKENVKYETETLKGLLYQFTVFKVYIHNAKFSVQVRVLEDFSIIYHEYSSVENA